MRGETPLEGSWTLALEIAGNPRDAATWQQELANTIEAIVCPDAVGVFSCILGDMLEATSKMAPRDHIGIGQRLVDTFLPRLHRAGLAAPWDAFAATADVPQPAMTRPIQTELLEPAGFKGMIGDVLRSRDGMVAGWIAVFTRAPPQQRRAEIEAPLMHVCRTAEGTLRRAVAIATLVGGRFPKISPSPLSDRERQIARLAANSLSDAAISNRLHISEGTVGRHLHNIFRKLGVGSRLELTELLCMRD